MINVRYPDHHSFHGVYRWCRRNCHGQFYSGTDWDNWIWGSRNRMFQFEDEKDAVAFALVWA